jgi:AcrR family transcriptional regulator
MSATRERLVEAATQLIRASGVHAVSLETVLLRAGTTKTTFYKYFESKEELALEVMRRQGKRCHHLFEQILDKAARSDPALALRDLAKHWDRWITEAMDRHCLFVEVCFAFPDRNEPLNRAACATMEDFRATIERLAERAGARSPADLSRQLLLLMTGAHVSEVICDNRTAAADIDPAVRLMVDAALGSPFPDHEGAISSRGSA